MSSPQISPTFVVAAAALLSISHSVGDAAAAAPVSGAHLWDDGHALSSKERRDLERRLAAAARRLGSPVFVLVAERLHHETADARAARAFAEHALDGQGKPNPVLLVMSARDGAAAIETGKGSAGIVPEIDARRITAELVGASRRAGLSASLARAIEAIVASAEATAARRRPLSPEEDLTLPEAPPGEPPEPKARTAGGDAGGRARADAAGVTDTVPASGEPEGEQEKPRRRSRLPIAVGLAALILLALAIRRRRNLTASTKDPPEPNDGGGRRWK